MSTAVRIAEPEISAVTDTTATVVFAVVDTAGRPVAATASIHVDTADSREPQRIISVDSDGFEPHSGLRYVRIDELEPASAYRIDITVDAPGGDEAATRHPIFYPGEIRTLPTPPGARLATIATISDLHFGEKECGRGPGEGPVFRADDEDPPYWEYMNRAIIDEIEAAAPDRVVVKGDLTSESEPYEFLHARDALAAINRPVDVLLGNHDMMNPEVDGYRLLDVAPISVAKAEVEGVDAVLVDTVAPQEAYGRLPPERLDELDDVLAAGTAPALVFGHHYTADPSKATQTFGIDRRDSARFLDVLARHGRASGYFAGHTHRNRLRRFTPTGPMPHVEVCATKEYPGGWALYHIHEGGYMQELRRCRASEALRWGETTKQMYGGWYGIYALGKPTHRCFTYRWDARL